MSTSKETADYLLRITILQSETKVLLMITEVVQSGKVGSQKDWTRMTSRGDKKDHELIINN